MNPAARSVVAVLQGPVGPQAVVYETGDIDGATAGIDVSRTARAPDKVTIIDGANFWNDVTVANTFFYCAFNTPAVDVIRVWRYVAGRCNSGCFKSS